MADWNCGLLLLLLTTACAPLTSSDTPACLSEILENTTVDVKPAINNGATSSDPVHVSTEANCLEKCCLANSASENWNCTFVIFDSRKIGNHPNCYLFDCPTDKGCPTKASAGINSHRIVRERAPLVKLHSKPKDSNPTYVNGNKNNAIFLDLQPPAPKNQAEPLGTGSNMNKSITSKILNLAEDIEKHLDKMDQSLKEENGHTEEEKKDHNPSSQEKPDIFFQLATTAAAIKQITTTKIITTTHATTTTTLTSTTTTTLPMTTLSTTTTATTTTPKPTAPPKPTTTSKPTTTTTSLPSTTTTPLPTTTTQPTTSTVTTTLPITTSKITTSLPTTTFTTPTTTATTRFTTTSTTTTETPPTMAPTTTPAKTATKHPFVKLRPANSHLYKTTSSKVTSSTTTPESRVPSKDVRPQDPLPKTRNSTGGDSKIKVSSPITPSVRVDSLTSSQNVNHGLKGFEKKILEDPNPDSKTGDRGGLLAALVFGVLFFAVVVFLVTRRALEAMHRRHYSRLDYLINGMYTDA